MYDLEPIGLILLFFLAALGGGLFLKYGKSRTTLKKQLPSPSQPEDKFETAVEFFPEFEFPAEPAKETIPELPWGYDDNKITVMARDPEWIFSYWDISESKREQLRNFYGNEWDGLRSVLRVYDITGIDYFKGNNANEYFDVEVNDRAGSWYVQVRKPGRTYCIELGKLLPDGTFVSVARSNPVTTPRNTVSDITDPNWMLVSENEKKLLGKLGTFDGFSSIDLFERQH